MEAITELEIKEAQEFVATLPKKKSDADRIKAFAASLQRFIYYNQMQQTEMEWAIDFLPKHHPLKTSSRILLSNLRNQIAQIKLFLGNKGVTILDQEIASDKIASLTNIIEYAKDFENLSAVEDLFRELWEDAKRKAEFQEGYCAVVPKFSRNLAHRIGVYRTIEEGEAAMRLCRGEHAFEVIPITEQVFIKFTK